MAQLVACPECKKALQVPENLLGKKVQCPECKHTFVATAEADEEPARTSTKTAPAPPRKKPAWEKDSNGAASSKKKKKSSEDEYEVEERDEDEDEEDDERPRRSRRRRSSIRSNFAPHRGGMILAFGIIGLVGGLSLCFPFIFGPIAWIMGSADLKEIRAGRMDPEGESMTQAGYILGIITTILGILGILLICGYFAVIIIFVGAIGAAANQQQRNFPQQRPPRF